MLCVDGCRVILIPPLGAQVCVLAFSTVDRDSFLAIESWKKKVSLNCGSLLPW